MIGDREKTLWFIIIMISICSIVAAGMELYPVTQNWVSAVERSQNTQIGADKDLENIINFLEIDSMSTTTSPYIHNSIYMLFFIIYFFPYTINIIKKDNIHE